MSYLDKKIYQSHVGSYRSCSKAFEFNKIKGLRLIRQAHQITQFGADAHDIMQTYYEKFPKKKVTEENINNRIENLFDNHVLEFSGNKALYRKIVSAFKSFELRRFHSFGEENYLPEIVEKELAGTLTTNDGREVKLAIKFDALFPNGLIIDWKFGKRIGDAQIQSGMSMIIAEQNGYSNIQFVFANLRLGKFIISPKRDMVTAKKMITDFVNGIEADSFVRKKTPLCRWCGFEVKCHYDEPVIDTARNWFDIQEVR